MSPRTGPSGGERVFRVLLRLYPRAFRERFEEEMVDFYNARHQEQRHRHGSRGAVRLWAHLIADIALNAPRQRLRALTPLSAHEVPFASPEYPPETHPMDSLRQDVRYALRSLVRHPAFAVVAALTLALGIGATTAIFSVVDAVLLRPLPWPDADRLVTVYGARGENRTGSVVYLDYRDWRAQSKAFDELGIIRGQSVNLTGGETPERVIGSFVTASTFRLLGASTLQGRLLSDSETEIATREPVAVVNEAMWRTRFGSRPDMVGRTLVLNGQSFTIVGIMRPGFDAPFGAPDVWLPLGYYPNKGDLELRGRPGVLVVGRLRAGVSVASAQSDLDVIAERLAALYPATNAGSGANVRPMKEDLVGDARSPLVIVLASVATVLLIACANVANLQLARAASRRRELSVRAALGAGRNRLMRQLLTESLILSSVGGLAGVGIAWLGVRWFARIVPDLLPVYGDVALNQDVLLFAGAITIVTGVLFGIAPAWRGSRTQLQEALAQRGSTGSVRLRAHHVLVVGQIALCCVLLVSAALLTRSLVAIAGVNPGFDPKPLLTLQFRLPAAKYDSEAKIAGMFERTIQEVRAVPGVRSAALARATPLNGNGDPAVPYQTEGSDVVDRAKLPTAFPNLISPDYFQTLNIPLLAGRDFTNDDRQGSMTVAIVNAQLAKKLAPDGKPLGKRIQVMDGPSAGWATVVGVVGNAKHFELNEATIDQLYLPTLQVPLIFTEVVVRANGDPMSVANAVRSAIWRVDRDQPVWRVRPVTTSIEGQLGSRKFTMRLLTGFAILAMLLATIGIYGVMSYGVAKRTQELGVRMALGARRTQVVGMVLRQGMRTTAIAIVIGLAASFAATRVLEAELFGVSATDPLTFAVVPLALVLIALAACYVPARRASRVDPVVALRAD
jgi:putative ABC transport system permease protein